LEVSYSFVLMVVGLMVSQGGSNVRLSVLSVQCEARQRSGARKVCRSFPRFEYVVTESSQADLRFHLKLFKFWWLVFFCHSNHLLHSVVAAANN
jgi:hypothetical protein